MEENIIKDIQGKTLANLPYEIDNIFIFPLSLKEIMQVSEKKYYYYLKILTITAKDLLNISDELDEKEIETIQKLNNFDTLMINFCTNTIFQKNILEAFSLFLCKDKEKAHFISDGKEMYFYIGEKKNNKIINRKNFDDIVKVIKIQNSIEYDEKKYNPTNKNVGKFIKRLNKLKKKTEEIKAKNGNSFELLDLVSILASKGNGLNIINIWDLNMYMFKDQLTRLQLNENYSIQKYLLGNSFAGASIDLKNNTYFCKIKNK
jgi:hypothetical protein